MAVNETSEPQSAAYSVSQVSARRKPPTPIVIQEDERRTERVVHMVEKTEVRDTLKF